MIFRTTSKQWLSIFYNKTNESWESNDGEQVQWFNWDKEEPRFEEINTVAQLRHDGLWSAIDRNQKRLVTCVLVIERHDLSESKFVFSLSLIASGIGAAISAAQGGVAIANAVKEFSSFDDMSFEIGPHLNDLENSRSFNSHFSSAIITQCFPRLSSVINDQIKRLHGIDDNDSNILSRNLKFALMDTIHTRLNHAQVNQRGFFMDFLDSAGDFLGMTIDTAGDFLDMTTDIGAQIAETVGDVVVDKVGALVDFGMDHFDDVSDVVIDGVIQVITDAASQALLEKFDI